jgi:hypothetical protein
MTRALGVSLWPGVVENRKIQGIKKKLIITIIKITR